MWVIKIGGSLAGDPRLPQWLQMLATHGGGRVAVVPGGGGFAELARRTQARWAFNDVAAHNMAVLAMTQVACLLSALEPRLRPVQSEAGVRDALHAGQPAVWMPLPLLREAADELTTWDVTSDSIALWLARRLNAERLVVIKACAVEPAMGLAELSLRGVVDHRFPDWAREAPFPIEVLGADELERVRAGLVGGDGPGSPGWRSWPEPGAHPGQRRSLPRRTAPKRDGTAAADDAVLDLHPRHGVTRH